jgi:hypothetical protein
VHALAWLALLGVVVTTTACPSQTPSCAVFVACQNAIDPTIDTGPWEPDGECWALPSTSRTCDAQCGVALDALRALPDPPTACDDTTS